MSDRPTGALAPDQQKGRPLSGEYSRRSAGVAAAVKFARRFAAPWHAVKAMSIAPPERLRIAPPEIRTADPTVADQIAAGYYTFAGKTAVIQGVSPFHVRPPSADWRRKLAGFSWLRHLRAADGPSARESAKARVAEFLAIEKFARDDPAMEPAIVARRLLSFLAQSPSLLDNATPEFYDAFMAALAQHARFLWRALASVDVVGAPRALCAIALVEYAVCADNGRKIAAQTSRALTEELDLQILSDGGHLSRNPQIALDFLLDLLPLRQVIAARGLQTPPAMVRAIDRIAPFLRMLQHGDGSLALFNGMGATAVDRLGNALAFEDARGAAPVNAPYAGYQRVEAKGALLIVDAGLPPPREFSRTAHAGCLSFEFSLQRERVVVNCGAPASAHADARELVRGTAAHSTLILDDHSSARILPANGPNSKAGLIVAGPTHVGVERRGDANGVTLALSHDGYAREFGLIHHRELTLAHDGGALTGCDRLLDASAARGWGGRRAHSGAATLRFHLHPRLRVARQGNAIEIDLANGERLLFAAEDWLTDIEESIFFADPGGARRCAQIVVKLDAAPGVEARWRFQRLRA